jgi:hypothetical protein
MTIFRGQFVGLVPLHQAAEARGSGAATRQQLLALRARHAPNPLDVLPARIRCELPVQAPCEATFEYLAERQPEWLIALVQRGALRDADLTFAVETVGRVRDSRVVRRVLLPLLHHPSAVVREGVIYGITNHLDAESRRELGRMVRQDLSPGVRKAAEEALSDE